MHGFVRKFDPKGRLTFVANYRNGKAHGVCWKVIRGGGAVIGRCDSRGVLTGMRIAYLYPDFKTAFVGSFEKGILESAQVAFLKTVVDDRGMKVIVLISSLGLSKLSAPLGTSRSRYSRSRRDPFTEGRSRISTT